MVKCALCGTPGVNKSTCPLYVKNPKPEHWKKHYKAKHSKETPLPKKIFLKQPTIQTPRSIGRTPPARITNPYVAKSREVNLVKKKIMESSKKNKHIILHGVDLVHFHINIKDPKALKIILNKSTSVVNKLDKILQLMLDIYIAMSQKLVTRTDYFTNPDSQVKKLIDMLNETKNQLLKLIIKHREGGDGGDTVPSFTVPLDEMITDLDYLAITKTLASLPKPPKSVPKVMTETKRVSYAGKRKHTRKNNKRRKMRRK